MSDGPRRDVTIASIGVAVFVAVVAALVATIPELDSAGKIAAVLIVAAVLLVPSAAVVIKEVRRLMVRREFGEELTAYHFEEETGFLLKGEIPNVSLRVESVHATIDGLVRAVPAEQRESALREAGYAVGENWAAEFKATLWQTGLREHEVARQLLRWSDYDATAGMGRLIVAMDPSLESGTVLLLNSFLSRSEASFPLNYWFAGYIAGTMDALFDRSYAVALKEPTMAAASHVGFSVTAE
jgi:hypothetical protein